MRNSHLFLTGSSLLAATLAITSVLSDVAFSQGVYIGPGGISLGTRAGSYYIPFNNGYSSRRGYYGPGGYYGPRDYFSRGGYSRGGLYWAPGMYWTPNEYWYGDRDWARFGSTNNRANRTDDPSADYGRPPLPQLEELQRMNWTHLRRVLAYGTAQLDGSLARVATGAKWADYLLVARLQAIVENEQNLPPSREEVEELLVMLNRYNETAEEESYKAVSGLWGFEAVHRALAEFLENPASRYRRQLAFNSTDLDRALERFETGASWQHYLSLPADLYVDPADVESAKNPPDPDKLRKALVRFDDVAKNPAYRTIADLSAFQATHASLARYLGRQETHEDQIASDQPPEDPSLNAPAPIEVSPQADPFSAEPNGAKSADDKNETKPTRKQGLRQVEELVPPESDPETTKAPAVREKE